MTTSDIPHGFAEIGDDIPAQRRLRILVAHLISKIECEHFSVSEVLYDDKHHWHMVIDMIYQGEEVGQTILDNAVSVNVLIKGARYAHDHFMSVTIPTIQAGRGTSRSATYLN